MSYVTISPVISGGGSRSVRVLLGEQPPTPEADGGWVVLPRPKKSGFTVWDGYAPHTMELSVMFDGFTLDQSQEDDIEALRLIMRKPVGLLKQPSPVKLKGPVPMADTLWVMQSISLDSSTLLRGSDGRIVRVAATISLVEYVLADFLASASPMAAALSKKFFPQTTYTVQSGDTLPSIAARLLGSWSRYTEIAQLNDIRDPRRIASGTVLRIS